MRPEGMICVNAAKADGRWSNAYAGQSEMVVPQEFLDLLQTDLQGLEKYNSMNKGQKYSIAFKIATALGVDRKARATQKIFESLKK